MRKLCHAIDKWVDEIDIMPLSCKANTNLGEKRAQVDKLDGNESVGKRNNLRVCVSECDSAV